MNAMLSIQSQCPGCERDFTPHGLAQHVSKTQDSCYHRVVATSQSHRLSAAFPRMASPLTLSSTWASQVAGEDALGDEPTQGEFIVTHVAAHGPVHHDMCCRPSCRLTKKFVDDDDLDHNGVSDVAGEDALGNKPIQCEIAVTCVAACPAIL